MKGKVVHYNINSSFKSTDELSLKNLKGKVEFFCLLLPFQWVILPWAG